jgi:hypothetical protein
VRTVNERSSFCSDVLRVRLHFNHLLDESIFMLGFVYEEGDDNFRKDCANGRLTNVGKLSFQLWKSGISAVHFLFLSKKQASNARMAEGPHCQATFLEFIQAMQKYRGPDIPFVFCAPNSNDSANLLFVLNWEAAHQYTPTIDWKKIKK